MQVDPDAGRLLNPITHVNKYVYVGSNPHNLIDPSGKIGFAVIILIGAVVGGGMSAKDEKGKFNLKNFLNGFFSGAASTAAGLAIITVIGPTTAGFILAGAVSGFTGSTTSLLLNGKSLRSKENLTYIGASTVLGGLTGVATSTFVGSINSTMSTYSYGTRESIKEFGTSGIGIINELTSPIFLKIPSFSSGCSGNKIPNNGECPP